MKISYNWLNEYFDNKLPEAGKLAEAITMNSVEVESVEKSGSDFIMDVKTLPNNNHSCLCHRGIAREAGTILNLKPKLYSREFPNLDMTCPSERRLEIKIADEKLCRRYIGRVVENISVGQSPAWLKEKIESMGQRSINNVVDATNFVMLEIGQPMHAFDADKLAGEDDNILIEVKNCKNGDWITTLDKKEVELDNSVLAITSKEIPLAIAGIKGGMYAELNENTKNIVLESANFDPILIRKTAQKLKIQTDASKRYENDYSPEMAGEAMDLLTKIIVEIAGTKDTKVGGAVDVYPRKANKYKLGISSKEASEILGIEITNKDIENIFDKFNFEYKKVKPIDEVLKMAPTFLGVPYKYGANVFYDAPKSFDCSGFLFYLFAEAGVAIPRCSVDQYAWGNPVDKKDLKPGDTIYINTQDTTTGPIRFKTIKFLPGKDILEGVDHCGLYLGDGKILHATGRLGKVGIEDISDEKLKKIIVGYRRMAENEERFVVTVPDERLDLRIKEDLAEEIGRIYGYEKIGDIPLPKTDKKPEVNKNFYYKEKVRRALYEQGFSEVINYSFTDKGEVELANPLSPEKKFLRTNLADGLEKSLEFNVRFPDLIDMTQIKVFEFGHVFDKDGEYERFALGVKNPTGRKKPKEKESLDEAIKAIEVKLGIADGLLRQKLPRNDKDGENIAEFDLSEMFKDLKTPLEYGISKVGDDTRRFKKISQYPFMIRDIAVFTPETTDAEKVFNIIESEAGDLLVKNKLFDVFTKKLEDGTQKTSYAYRLIFQSMEKTLSDIEINAIMEKITKKLNANNGWQVR